MKNTEGAFHWIVDILERRGITYKISGGLASRAYGVNRELADIDIEVAEEDIPKLVVDVKPYITLGPERHKNDKWDLELMVLEHQGQEIELCGTHAKLFNPKTREWEPASGGDLKRMETKEIFGRKVPVESREALMAYKSRLAREVDLEDIRQLNEIYGTSN